MQGSDDGWYRIMIARRVPEDATLHCIAVCRRGDNNAIQDEVVAVVAVGADIRIVIVKQMGPCLQSTCSCVRAGSGHRGAMKDNGKGEGSDESPPRVCCRLALLSMFAGTEWMRSGWQWMRSIADVASPA